MKTVSGRRPKVAPYGVFSATATKPNRRPVVEIRLQVTHFQFSIGRAFVYNESR